jgi:hypothetical protein
LAFTTIVPTFGIVVIVPAAITVVLVPMVNPVTFKSAFAVSTSESFVKTLPVAGLSSLIVLESATATGTSFTAVMLKPKVAGLLPP